MTSVSISCRPTPGSSATVTASTPENGETRTTTKVGAAAVEGNTIVLVRFDSGAEAADLGIVRAAAGAMIEALAE